MDETFNFGFGQNTDTTPHKSLYTDVILAVESVRSFLNLTMEVNQVMVSSMQNEISE